MAELNVTAVRAAALGEENPMRGESEAWAAIIPIPDEAMEVFVPVFMKTIGFQPDGAGSMSAGVATGSRSKNREYGFRTASREHLRCRWQRSRKDPSATILGWVVLDGERRPMRSQTQHIGSSFLRAAVEQFKEREVWGPPRDPVVGPGEPFEGPFTGQLTDLSATATQAELLTGGPESLARGVLPLGRHLHGADLHLGRFGDERMEYRGTLVCAPPGAGKTELILRWAVSAIANGYSVLVVDVKGVLNEEIRRRLAEAGVEPPHLSRYFSTNPDPAVRSDRINFLAGLSTATAEDRAGLEQLARAILPIEGFERGDERRFHENRVAYLTAMLGLVKLRESYEPHPERRDYDLSDVYEIASRERTLMEWLAAVARHEGARRKRSEEPNPPGLERWFDELAVLFPASKQIKVPAGPTLVGQREARDSYRYFTQGIVNALRPFSSWGVLGRRVSGHAMRRGEGLSFRLTDLIRPEQALVVLEARELDVGGAEAVVSLAASHLQMLLNRRHPEADPRPLLLLLDETARLRGFDAKKYVALCRSAKAAVVLVYQQLDQIAAGAGDDRGPSELLENVGTQIFLGSLAGRNHELFSRQRGMRWRETVTRTGGPLSSAREQSIAQIREEEVPVYPRLPGGRYPALVYIRDHPAGKPFLVDMDRSHFVLRRIGDDGDGGSLATPLRLDELDLPPVARRILEGETA
jgi:hypothetical protein